jgi:hypothetical protein
LRDGALAVLCDVHSATRSDRTLALGSSRLANARVVGRLDSMKREKNGRKGFGLEQRKA